MLNLYIMSTELLEINIINLTKKYNNFLVFNNLNLNFKNDFINFLVSENGSGKSTLIKCILKLTKFKGEITTNCKTMSYCPDKINLPDFITIEYFLSLFNIDQNKATVLLSQFKLKKELHVNELSKGMHQKLLIIQCLCKDADVYLFDEPLNGLDKNSENIFLKEITELFHKNKLIIISSHQIEHYFNMPLKIYNLKEVFNENC